MQRRRESGMHGTHMRAALSPASASASCAHTLLRVVCSCVCVCVCGSVVGAATPIDAVRMPALFGKLHGVAAGRGGGGSAAAAGGVIVIRHGVIRFAAGFVLVRCRSVVRVNGDAARRAKAARALPWGVCLSLRSGTQSRLA